eukprot:TRINITY_DN6688_c0_g1_i1.p2 TRINITY_DN6688_c0_g1~~TRINITY_DN6688_c0_g1_i1.p2  ORF type:complete len:526 (+),score=77.12 TRINITY_DN6688_c0_g1_i1:219-1796(+)
MMIHGLGGTPAQFGVTGAAHSYSLEDLVHQEDAVQEEDSSEAQRAKQAAEKREKEQLVFARNRALLLERLATLLPSVSTTTMEEDEDSTEAAKFYDVTIFVGPDAVPVRAHKAILALSSPILKAMLLSGSGTQAQDTLQLPDIPHHTVFRKAMQFMYTGELKVKSVDTLEVLQVAEKLDIAGLTSLCIDRYIRKTVNMMNAFDLYEDTFKKHKQQLSFECLFFIEKNFGTLVKSNSEGFLQLSEGPLIEILKSDNLTLSDEYVLFVAVREWGIARAAAEGITTPTTSWLQDRLRNVLPHIRFALMNQQGLQEAEKTGLIPEYLLFEAFRHHVLSREKDIPENLRSVAVDTSNPRLRRRKYQTTFFWDDLWHGQNIQVEDKGHTVRKMKPGWFSIAVGNTGFSTGIHYWEILINGVEFHVGVTIKGISSNHLDNFLGASQESWAYEGVGFKKHVQRVAYGQPFTSGDKIGVHLDTERGKLSFFVNGKKQGIAFDNLPIGVPIFPAVGWRDGTATILPAWSHLAADV